MERSEAFSSKKQRALQARPRLHIEVLMLRGFVCGLSQAQSKGLCEKGNIC